MSSHRGCKEMDVILGNFAEKHLNDLSEDQLEIYERLLNESDQDIYDGLIDIIYGKKLRQKKLCYCEEILKKIANSTSVT
jgi:succinate dehydrogenase flavin-adding protein (antitoxin of CptAB toxin-antitoxin module)